MDSRSQPELPQQAGVEFAQSQAGTGGDSGNLDALTARLSLQPTSQENSSTRETDPEITGDLQRDTISRSVTSSSVLASNTPDVGSLSSELSRFIFEDTTRLSKRTRDQVIAVWALVRIFSGPNSTVVRNTQADDFGWKSFRVRYEEAELDSDVDDNRNSALTTLMKSKTVKWMDKTYEVHTRLGGQDMFRKMICNSVWAPEQIYAWNPSKRYWRHRDPGRSKADGVDGEVSGTEESNLRLYEDVMSADWAYNEYVCPPTVHHPSPLHY